MACCLSCTILILLFAFFFSLAFCFSACSFSLRSFSCLYTSASVKRSYISVVERRPVVVFLVVSVIALAVNSILTHTSILNPSSCTTPIPTLIARPFISLPSLNTSDTFSSPKYSFTFSSIKLSSFCFAYSLTLVEFFAVRPKSLKLIVLLIKYLLSTI